MKSLTIMAGERFELISYGNGLSYTLADRRNERSAFLQGDEAATFREELEVLEGLEPEWSVDKTLGYLWSEHGYGDASTLDEAS